MTTGNGGRYRPHHLRRLRPGTGCRGSSRSAVPRQPCARGDRRRSDRARPGCGRIFGLRFRAYGRRHFVTLSGAADGWTRQRADAELRHVLADVEQDDHARRADPGRGGGAGPDRAQPGPREHAQPQAQGKAQAAGLPRVGGADRCDDRRRRRARRQAPGPDRRSPRLDRDAGLRRPADRRGHGADVAGRRPGQRRISVGDSKTEAGVRLVDILPALRDELTNHRHATAEGGPTHLVFPTSSGSRRDKDNARERVIRPVVAHAETVLLQRMQQPLPDGVTAHKLRHTFASILFVRVEDPPYVMAQLGHHGPRCGVTSGGGARPHRRRNPRDAGTSGNGRGGFRTCDLSRVKRALSH